MKKLLLFFFITQLISGCTKQNGSHETGIQIADDCYQGYFEYKDALYYSLICFEDNKYEEWPSGGVIFQKSPGCLTVGTYSINNSTLSFRLDSFKHAGFALHCETGMLLPGDYKIINTNYQDSLVFEKGTGHNRIIYYLKAEGL